MGRRLPDCGPSSRDCGSRPARGTWPGDIPRGTYDPFFPKRMAPHRRNERTAETVRAAEHEPTEGGDHGGRALLWGRASSASSPPQSCPRQDLMPNGRRRSDGQDGHPPSNPGASKSPRPLSPVVSARSAPQRFIFDLPAVAGVDAPGVDRKHSAELQRPPNPRQKATPVNCVTPANARYKMFYRWLIKIGGASLSL